MRNESLSNSRRCSRLKRIAVAKPQVPSPPLRSKRTELAPLLQMHTLLQLLLPEIAAHHRMAVLDK